MQAFSMQSWLEESVGHLQALLRIDTTNPPGREADATAYLARVLDSESIECTLVESAPGRSNLVARLQGSGAREDALLLNGHLDVVPAEPEHWKYPPFSGALAEGCLWGRGAIDMKNMVVMSLMTLVALKRLGLPLRRDVVLAAVADEEAGCHLGSSYLVEKHPELIRCKYVLNEVGGQTTHIDGKHFYPIQVAEKGVCWFEVVADGVPGHGSLPHDDNAVGKVCQAMARLCDQALPARITPEVDTFFRSLARNSSISSAAVLHALRSPSLGDLFLKLLRARNEDLARSFSAMRRSTATPTGLEAGSKINVVPSGASATVDGRLLPGVGLEAFLEQVRRVTGPDVRFNVLDFHEGVRFPVATELFDCIVQTLQDFDPGSIAVPYMNPAFTDSFAYSRLGAVCYGFAPIYLPREIEFGKMFHGHDERIPVEGYKWGQRALLALVTRFCAERE